MGQLTGGVAHDFNNLLAFIMGNAEPHQRPLAFSQQQALRTKEIDIAGLAGGMTELLRRTLGETIAIETRTGAELWTVEADPVQLEDAILNLAINARCAMPDGGRPTIQAQNERIDQSAAGTDQDPAAGQPCRAGHRQYRATHAGGRGGKSLRRTRQLEHSPI